MSGILIKSYGAPKVNYLEACRLAGGKSEALSLKNDLEECYKTFSSGLCYRVCYKEFPLGKEGDALDLGFAKVCSKDLARALSGCEGIVLFAATVGSLPDRMVLRQTSLSPYKALLYQAAGSERVESLCDLFCADLKNELEERGQTPTPRFSPGYGDLPLSLQRAVFSALQPERHLGLTLNDSLLMSPCKSVTAIVGLRSKS